MFPLPDMLVPDRPAAADDRGRTLTYGRLSNEAEGLAGRIPARSLVFCFCENSFGALIGYAGALAAGAVPLLLDRRQDPDQARALIETYRPAFIWRPEEAPPQAHEQPPIHGAENFILAPTGLKPFPLNDELGLLISTSGSTGGPKLVRQSLKNLNSNADSIAQYLEIGPDERPVTTLPMNYVYGLSVVNSHLRRGATLLLTDSGLAQKDFWTFLTEGRATSLAGVPYTYEMLKRLRFLQKDWPDLKTLTQAGGKLAPELHREFAQWALDRGKKFVVMYGAAEATARMAWLPPHLAMAKAGGIGGAIPGGRLTLQDQAGREITAPGEVGELVYYGDNVTLGYAEKGEDLSLGDQRGGRLATGDLARRDEDGCHYIVGRQNRFLKIFGNRVGLDETEALIKTAFPDLDCACAGRDDLMSVFITDPAQLEAVRAHLAQATRLHPSAFRLQALDQIPKNESGKTLYTMLGVVHDRVS